METCMSAPCLECNGQPSTIQTQYKIENYLKHTNAKHWHTNTKAPSRVQICRPCSKLHWDTSTFQGRKGIFRSWLCKGVRNRHVLLIPVLESQILCNSRVPSHKSLGVTSSAISEINNAIQCELFYWFCGDAILVKFSPIPSDKNPLAPHLPTYPCCFFHSAVGWRVKIHHQKIMNWMVIPCGHRLLSTHMGDTSSKLYVQLVTPRTVLNHYQQTKATYK